MHKYSMNLLLILFYLNYRIKVKIIIIIISPKIIYYYYYFIHKLIKLNYQKQLYTNHRRIETL